MKSKSFVFIMGAHRSGTTILYNLLAESLSAAYLTPFHIASFSTFRRAGLNAALAMRPKIIGRFSDAQIKDRRFDDFPAGPDTPEEYGFVLPGGSLTKSTLPHFRSMAEFVCATAEGDPKCLILKNPRDFGRVFSIRRLFPSAAFVFIHRRPEHVLRSRARELRDLFDARSEYQSIIEPFYDRVSRSRFALFLLRAATRLEPWFNYYLAVRQATELRAYLRYSQTLMSDKDIEIRYEDLCSNPEQTLTHITSHIRGNVDSTIPVLNRLRPPRSDYLAHSGSTRLLRRLAPLYYERWGY